jgi:hypothetical protein
MEQGTWLQVAAAGALTLHAYTVQHSLPVLETGTSTLLAMHTGAYTSKACRKLLLLACCIRHTTQHVAALLAAITTHDGGGSEALKALRK